MSRSLRASVTGMFVLAASIPVGLALTSSAAGAATVVTTEGALDAAVLDGAETSIVLGNDITLTCGGAGQLNRSENTNALTIDGAGFTLTQSCGGFRVLAQSGTAAVTFSDITIVGIGNGWNFGGVVFSEGDIALDHASLTGGNGAGQGAGIWSDADVVLTWSLVFGNAGTNGGGGVWAAGAVTAIGSSVSGNTTTDTSGGGIEAGGAVTVTSSAVFSNHATGGGSGGGIDAQGAVSVTGSTIADNQAGDTGGGIRSFGPVSLTSSVLYGNSTEGDTGGGGAVDAGQGGPVDIVNSTIMDNSSGAAAGGGVIGGNVHLVYSDVVHNTAADGANLAWEGELQVFGSVVAQPNGGGENCSFAGSSSSSGYNFSDDSSCGFTATGDRQDAGDPMLHPLAHSANGSVCFEGCPGGGLPLLPGSPLLDAIPPAHCQDNGAATVTTDVFATTRPQGTGCDIGAVEMPPTPSAPPAPPVPVPPHFTG